MEQETTLCSETLTGTGSSHSPPEMTHKEALEKEIVERLNLQMAIKECSTKYEQAVRVQSELDEDLTLKESELESARRDIKQKKQTIHQLESEIAQVTADHINGQSRWLNSVAQLNDEIGNLRQRLKDQEKEMKRLSHKQKSPCKSQKSQAAEYNVQVAYDRLEKHQNQLMIKELMARQEQIQNEMVELRNVNQRLQQENETIQHLVIDHTIHDDLGGMSLNDDLCLPEEYESGENLSPQETSDHTQMNTMQFEVQSLQNHNRALKLSLERLVHSFLESPQLVDSAQRSIDPQVIRQFNQRVASHNEKQLDNVGNSQFLGHAVCNQISPPSSKRILSLGVDSEARSIPAPQLALSSSSRSSSGDTRATTPSEEESTIQIPKRTESQTGLRRLRINS